MKFNNCSNFPKTTLFEEINRRAIAGKEGAISIRRYTQSGELRLCAGAKRLPVIKMRLHLRCEGCALEMREENFFGELALDDRGDGSESVRLAILDDEGRTIMGSDMGGLEGNLYIAALYDEEKPRALCFSALFRKQDDGKGSNIVMWDKSREWLAFADALNEMLEGKENGTI